MHQRLFDQARAKGLAIATVVDRLYQRLTHQPGRAQHAVQPRLGHHFDNGRYPAPGRAYAISLGIEELDFGRGIGMIAELVLQALDFDCVALTGSRPARQQEARQSGVFLGEHEKGIAHGRREEPLVADQAEAAVVARRGAGGIGAHVRATLLFGHAHANGQSVLFARRGERRVVAVGEDAGQPLCGQIGRMTQRRHAGMGHGDRAHRARFHLIMDIEQRRAHDLRALALGGPGQSVQAVFLGQRHAAVVRRMKAHLVDAVAIAIEGGEFGAVLVGVEADFDQLGAGNGAIGLEPVLTPVAALPAYGLDQRRIRCEHVVVLERRGLVGDVVRAQMLSRLTRGVGHNGHPVRIRSRDCASSTG